MARDNTNRKTLAPIIYKKSLEGFTHAEIQQWLAENNHKVYTIAGIKKIVQYYRELSVPEINVGEEKKRILDQFKFIYNTAMVDYVISKKERKEKSLKKRIVPTKQKYSQPGRASDMFESKETESKENENKTEVIEESHIKTIETVGDARLLKIAVEALAQQAKLLGLDKDIETTQDESIIWEEIRTYEAEETTEIDSSEEEEEEQTKDVGNDKTQQETN